jgi:hypothetical protein
MWQRIDFRVMPVVNQPIRTIGVTSYLPFDATPRLVRLAALFHWEANSRTDRIDIETPAKIVIVAT